MDQSLLSLEIDGALAVLTLNRSAQRNALLTKTLESLISACASIEAHDEVNVMLLRGAGRSFSVGFDLKSMASMMASGGADPAALGASASLGARAVDALANLRAVTIGAAHGHAIGGGFLLFAACDIRVAAQDTVFSIPEVDLGVPLTWGGVPLLFRELGPSRTRELILTCRRFGTDVLTDAGFLYQTFTSEQFDVRVDALARELSAKPGWALKDSKRQFVAAAQATELSEADLFANALTHPDFMATAMRYMASISNK